MGSPPPALSVSSFAGSQNFINAALIKCFCAVVCIRGFLILPQDPKRIFLQCQLGGGCELEVCGSVWKCVQLSAGVRSSGTRSESGFFINPAPSSERIPAAVQALTVLHGI